MNPAWAEFWFRMKPHVHVRICLFAQLDNITFHQLFSDTCLLLTAGQQNSASVEDVVLKKKHFLFLVTRNPHFPLSSADTASTRYRSHRPLWWNARRGVRWIASTSSRLPTARASAIAWSAVVNRHITNLWCIALTLTEKMTGELWMVSVWRWCLAKHVKYFLFLYFLWDVNVRW